MTALIVNTVVREHPGNGNYRIDVKSDRIVIYARIGPDADEIIDLLKQRGTPIPPNPREHPIPLLGADAIYDLY